MNIYFLFRKGQAGDLEREKLEVGFSREITEPFRKDDETVNLSYIYGWEEMDTRLFRWKEHD